MRIYTFSHNYLSVKQQLIQAMHATVEMFNHFEKIDLVEYGMATGDNPPVHIVTASKQADVLYDWSKNHKTHIALNGGNSPEMKALAIVLANEENPYPSAQFNEEDIDDMLTSMAIVLPEKIYEASALLRNKEVHFVGGVLGVSNWEKYNSEFNLQGFEDLQKQVDGYGFYDEFDKGLVEILGNYRMV